MNYRWLSLFLLWLLSILLIQAAGNFPLNDDWQYAFAVKSLLETGTLEYRGYFSPIVLAQVYWGYLFHSFLSDTFSFTILRWSTLVLVPIGLLFIQYFSRRLNPNRQAEIMIGLAFLFSPLIYSLAPSFMSDVPFMVVALAALATYWQFWEGKGPIWLALALILSIVSFYIRQPGLVLPLIFAGHWVWSKNSNDSSADRPASIIATFKGVLSRPGHLVLIIAALSFSLALLLSWKWGLQPALGLTDNFKGDESNYLAILIHSPLTFGITWSLRMVKSFVYLGFFTLIFLPWWLRDPKLRSMLLQTRFLLISALISLLLVGSAYWAGKPFPFGGNIFYNLGLGPELLADTYTLSLPNTPGLPSWSMGLFHFLAAWWGLAVVFVFIRQYRRFHAHQRAFIQLWVMTSLLYLSLMAITSYYDRYILLPLALLFPMLTIPTPSFQGSLQQVWLAWLPLILVALFSVTATHDYLAWNKARKRAWTWLQQQDISIQQVDAGYEWNGWLNYGAKRIEAEDVPFWWVTDNEYMISFGPVAGYRSIHQEPFRRWLWSQEDAIFVLQRDSI